MAYLINDFNLRVDSDGENISAYIEDTGLPVDKSIILSLLMSIPRDTKLFNDRVNTNLNNSLRIDLMKSKNLFIVFKGVEVFTTGELSGAKTVTVNDIICFLNDTLLGEE